MKSVVSSSNWKSGSRNCKVNCPARQADLAQSSSLVAKISGLPQSAIIKLRHSPILNIGGSGPKRRGYGKCRQAARFAAPAVKREVEEDWGR
jgi:hypothetical protein